MGTCFELYALSIARASLSQVSWCEQITKHLCRMEMIGIPWGDGMIEQWSPGRQVLNRSITVQLKDSLFSQEPWRNLRPTQILAFNCLHSTLTDASGLPCITQLKKTDFLAFFPRKIFPNKQSIFPWTKWTSHCFLLPVAKQILLKKKSYTLLKNNNKNMLLLIQMLYPSFINPVFCPLWKDWELCPDFIHILTLKLGKFQKWKKKSAWVSCFWG